MTQLPRPEGAGTLTFLFTDIEGSTRLWEENPEAMKQALARHDALLRDVIKRHGGHVFKTLGDGFCAVFSSAARAAQAALVAQRAIAECGFGMCTTEPRGHGDGKGKGSKEETEDQRDILTLRSPHSSLFHSVSRCLL